MSQPSRVLREPLVHFVVAGAVLFAAFAVFRGDEVREAAATTHHGRPP